MSFSAVSSMLLFLFQSSAVKHHTKSTTLMSVDPRMYRALPALHVLDPQTAQLLPPNPMIEQGSQDGAIAHALERVRWRRHQPLARWGVTQRRRASSVA